jgi:hypothetical protein
MKKIILSSVVLAAIFFSCKKDSTPTPTPTPTPVTFNATSVLGSWKITSDSAWLSNGTASQTFDVLHDTSFYATCQIDDIYTFNTGGTYVYTDAGVSCGNGNGSGTWSASGNTMTIDTYSATVTDFSSTKMRMVSPNGSFDDTDAVTGVITQYTYNFRTTYTKQ